jgi:PAS domain S-box-containing protein
MLEERCRRIVEAAPSAMVLVNGAGTIELVNRLTEVRFGYERSEMLGQSVDMLVPDAVRPRHAALRGGFVAQPVTRPMGKDADLHGRRKDGTVFPVEIGLNTIDTEDGLMVLAAIVDITERREAETVRRLQTVELTRSNTDLQEFAYVVSHDLKAPLRAISLLADWITDDIRENASADTLENLRLMGHRVGRMSMLLDGLLSYTRVGHRSAPAVAVDVGALVGDIVQSIAPPPGFSVRFEGDAPVINTPRPPLEHVLQNLISNAIKHHDRGAGEVVVTAVKVNDSIEFCISDDGPGIAPEFHKRVFTIFQTLSSRDDCETSGVGLSIVQKTVERLGKRVWIESEPPRRGSRFFFTWPV